MQAMSYVKSEKGEVVCAVVRVFPVSPNGVEHILLIHYPSREGILIPLDAFEAREEERLPQSTTA